MERTVGLIYETIADPQAWREVVNGISAQVGASAAWMFQPGPAGPTYFALSGISDSVVRAYMAYYHNVDVLVREGFRREGELAGRALRERDIVDEATWLNSEMYNDLCAPNGVGQILTAPLAHKVAKVFPPILSFFRAPGAALFPDEAVGAVQGLLPHLQRAVRLRTTIAGQFALPSWTASLLEQLPFGVFLLGSKGQVLHANRVGRTVLDKRDGLLIREGRLAASNRVGAGQLEALLAACLSRHPTGGEMQVPRPGGAAWLVSACPLSVDSIALFGEERCRAWVCITEPMAHRPELPRRLGRLFGLSPAEQRIAVALLSGLSPSEIAERSGVSLPTVRTQVQSILGKLGVRRQAELVRMIATAAALPIDTETIINSDDVV